METDANLLRLVGAIPTFIDSNNEPRVSNFRCNKISTNELYVDTQIILNGEITSDLNISGRLFIGDGSISDPAISFLNNRELGLYRSNVEEISFVSNSTSLLQINPTNVRSNVPISTLEIITPGGDLSLNPTAGNIDCNGKNLINVGSIVQNTNYYNILSDPVITNDDVPTNIFSIPTLNNNNYYIRVIISYANITDSTSTGNIENVFKAKNLNSVLTLTDNISTSSAIDSSLNDVGISRVVSGNNILIDVIGNFDTIEWYCVAEIFRHPINN